MGKETPTGEQKSHYGISLTRFVASEEEERKRIARKLRDQTCQSLHVVLVALDSLSASRSDREITRDRIRGIREQVAHIAHDIQEVLEDFRPAILEDFGLEASIRWLLERHIARQGIKTRFAVEGSYPASWKVRTGSRARTELVLFRVVQEAVLNAATHAEASAVHISLVRGDGGVGVEIDDDGNGFDIQKVFSVRNEGAEPRGLGLLAMRERVALLNGKFTIYSQPEKGTHLSVFVPFH